MKKYVGIGTLIFVTIIWGGAFPAVKIALRYISPMAFISLRFSFALIILLPFIGKIFKKSSKELLIGGCVLGIFYFLGFAFQTAGLKYTSATKSGFFTGMFVVFTPVFQMIIERRIPSKESIIGTILVLFGLILLSSGGKSILQLFQEIGSNFNFGDFLTIICAVFFSAYVVYLDIYSKKFDEMPLVFLQIAITAVGGVLLTLFFAGTGIEKMHINFSNVLIYAVLYTAILSTILTTFLQTKYQKYITPTKAGIIFSLEPIFSAVFAFFILSEKISIFGAIGCLFIFAGLLVSEAFGKSVNSSN